VTKVPWFDALLAVALSTAGLRQESPHLEIATVRYFADRSGGGRISTWRPLTSGQPVLQTVYNYEKGCGFIFGANGEVPSNVVIGWKLQATPVDITPEHVRLRIAWSREVDSAARARPSEDVTILLRPGDVVSLDSAVLPRCQNSLATFVIALKGEAPGRRRVASTDLWLVHRQPGGKEHTEQVNVRGGFDERIPFVFDHIVIDALRVDVAGSITLRSGTAGEIALELDTNRNVMGSASGSEWGYFGGGSTVLRVTPGDVISIEFPFPASAGFEALREHSLSIRIRSRQIR
jgi:hypothetical protein